MSWMDKQYWFWLNIKSVTLEGLDINNPSIVWRPVALVDYYDSVNTCWSYWCYETGEVYTYE